MTDLLEVQGLRKNFTSGGKIVKALDDVSLVVASGEVLGVVGESGSGKSTLGRSILQLEKVDSGRVFFDGYDLFSLFGKTRKAVRRQLQTVFQDPFSSLNPRMRVGQIIAEGLVIHGIAKGAARRERVNELLHAVGLRPEHRDRYPHEFSGGQRQRIGIARALSVDPKLIITDEAVSALDVSIQAQVLNLLRDLQEQRNLSYLFISHDLRVVEYVSSRVAVMYLGRIIETASKEDIFREPRHPYTRALISAIPTPDPSRRRSEIAPVIETLPESKTGAEGCSYYRRCPHRQAICAEIKPALLGGSDGNAVGCHVFGPT